MSYFPDLYFLKDHKSFLLELPLDYKRRFIPNYGYILYNVLVSNQPKISSNGIFSP